MRGAGGGRLKVTSHAGPVCFKGANDNVIHSLGHKSFREEKGEGLGVRAISGGEVRR